MLVKVGIVRAVVVGCLLIVDEHFVELSLRVC